MGRTGRRDLRHDGGGQPDHGQPSGRPPPGIGGPAGGRRAAGAATAGSGSVVPGVIRAYADGEAADRFDARRLARHRRRRPPRRRRLPVPVGPRRRRHQPRRREDLPAGDRGGAAPAPGRPGRRRRARARPGARRGARRVRRPRRSAPGRAGRLPWVRTPTSCRPTYAASATASWPGRTARPSCGWSRPCRWGPTGKVSRPALREQLAAEQAVLEQRAVEERALEEEPAR